MKRQIAFTLALASLLVLPMSVQAQQTDTAAVSIQAGAEAAAAQQDLISTLKAQGNFTVLVDALKRTGLTAQLESGYTLFAPTDAAFNAVPDARIEAMTAEQWASLLRRHIVPQPLMRNQLSGKAQVETVTGAMLTVSSANGNLMVGDATVVNAGIQTQSGVVYAVDAVLMPSADEATPSYGK